MKQSRVKVNSFCSLEKGNAVRRNRSARKKKKKTRTKRKKKKKRSSVDCVKWI